VILLEMLTGTNPFRSSGNYAQTVLNHVQMPVPRLPAHLSDYQHLLDRMLAKDPDERFADCRALLASLDELQDPDDLDYTHVTVAPRLDKARGRRRATLLLWSLFALLLVGVAVGGGYQLQQRMKIADLLERGEQRLAEGKLLEPAQDNADYFFRQVLLLDKRNAQAQDGLQRVLQARIADYLQLAEQRFAEDQLLLPEDDSAVFYYRRVLGWQPQHEQALAGLKQVAQRYVQMSEAAYARRQFAQALEYIKRGLEAQPDDPTLLALYDDHERRVRAARVSQVARTSNRPLNTTSAANDTGQEKQNPVKRLWNRIFSN
jgi:tetratricopeptide (TPR) repeat protein